MTSSRARLLLLAGLTTLVVLASVAAAAQADTLDQQQGEAIIAQTVAGPSNMYPVSEAQVFTAGLSGWIDRVQLYLSGSSNTGGLTVEITTVDNVGGPTATVLASTTVPAAAVSSAGGWVEADFSPPAPVSSGTKYAIVAYAGGSDVYGWYSANGSPYTGGQAFFDTASPPSAWTDNAGVSLAFMTYVSSALPGTATPSPGSLIFGTQAQTTVSPPKTMTITNTGQSGTELDVTGFGFTGSDPGDFLISSETCGAPIPAGGSCQATVRFAPEAEGTRTANLQIYSNDPNGPANVYLSGTGGQLPQGPTGPQGTSGTTGDTGAAGAPGAGGSSGATGAQGPAGASGAQGPAGQDGAPGKVELVMCKTVTRHHKKQVQCAGRLVSGSFALTGSGLVAATVHRGDTTYATGERLDLGGGRSELVLAALRPVSGGRYTLTLRYRSGRRSITSNRRITLN